MIRVSAARSSKWTVAALLAVALGCGQPDRPRARDAQLPGGLSDPGTGARVGAAARAAPADERVAATHAETRPLVLFLGDSLTAGYGLAVDEAYPARVEQLLAAEGTPIRAVNAGVSGDTSAGGLERVDRLLAQQPVIVVVEFGANDGLRGQRVDGIAANLREIVRRAQTAGARVVVAGMRIPPNYGPEYAEEFAAIYPAVAKATGATLLPFLLVEVAGRPELNQADGIHPTAEGQRRVARTVAGVLRPILQGR
jgi:acyl-CoA thioesterase-1